LTVEDTDAMRQFLGVRKRSLFGDLYACSPDCGPGDRPCLLHFVAIVVRHCG
jgi:hypothetical protein